VGHIVPGRLAVSTAILVAVFLLSGCDPRGHIGQTSRAEPDGVQIDGIWVGDPTACPSFGDKTCARLTACAQRQIWPNGAPAIAQVRWFNLPDRLKDGTLIVRGMSGLAVVFDVVEGPPRATHLIETDSC